MYQQTFCTLGDTAALRAAAFELWSLGWEYDASAKIILLPVPSFDTEGRIRGGGRLEDNLPDDAVIFGGNLAKETLSDYRCFDLLKDPFYLAENAAITAHCALGLGMEHLSTTLDGCPVLVLGWGRIGRCLARLLRALHADVTVYARKEEDRALLSALGYSTLSHLEDAATIKSFPLIYNTAPTLLLTEEMVTCRQVKIDLASTPGIRAKDVIWARGLPNAYAPASSGALIAKTVDRIGKELLL